MLVSMLFRWFRNFCTLFTGRAVQMSKGPCDNWLVAVRTSRPTFIWTSVNAFLFGKDKWNANACGTKYHLSMNNVVFQTGYKPKCFPQHELDAESPSCLIMLALWDNFATDIAILSSVRHSWECPQGDEHHRNFLEFLNKCLQGSTLLKDAWIIALFEAVNYKTNNAL